MRREHDRAALAAQDIRLRRACGKEGQIGLFSKALAEGVVFDPYEAWREARVRSRPAHEEVVEPYGLGQGLDAVLDGSPRVIGIAPEFAAPACVCDLQLAVELAAVVAQGFANKGAPGAA